MRPILVTCFTLMIAACNQTSPPPSPASQSNIHDRTPSAVLAAFKSDLAICTSIVRVLRADRSFVESFLSADSRKSKPLETFLRQSPYSITPEVSYVLRNPKYFQIEVSFHGDPWAVAWVENEAIYCAPTFERLKEIEALGESEEAWSIRVFFLDRALQSLSQPSLELLDGTIEFEEFQTYVAEASRRYSHTQQAAFLAWTKKAIETIQLGRKKIEDGSAGRSISQQNKMLDDRIFYLRRFAKTDA